MRLQFISDFNLWYTGLMGGSFSGWPEHACGYIVQLIPLCAFAHGALK